MCLFYTSKLYRSIVMLPYNWWPLGMKIPRIRSPASAEVSKEAKAIESLMAGGIWCSDHERVPLANSSFGKLRKWQRESREQRGSERLCGI